MVALLCVSFQSAELENLVNHLPSIHQSVNRAVGGNQEEKLFSLTSVLPLVHAKGFLALVMGMGSGCGLLGH